MDFEAALRLDALVVCARCRHLAARPVWQPDGWCNRFAVETWQSIPFACEGYEGIP